MNTGIFFYAVDPGALALMDALARGRQVGWIAGGWVAEIFSRENRPSLSVEAFLEYLDAQDKKPAVLMGAQNDFGATRELASRLRAAGCQIYFLFDHWCNFSEHFNPGDGVLPDRFFVMDDTAKQSLLSSGFQNSRIDVIGHAAIEETIDAVQKVDVSRSRAALRVPNDVKWITFATEPIRDDVKEPLGYDEHTVFETISEISSRAVGRHELFVRLHPRQNRTKFLERLPADLRARVRLWPEGSAMAETIAASDLLLGMTSVFLIHALFCGKPCWSLQFGRNDRAKRVIHTHIDDVMIIEPRDFERAFNRFLNEGANDRPFNRRIERGSARHFWRSLER